MLSAIHVCIHHHLQPNTDRDIHHSVSRPPHAPMNIHQTRMGSTTHDTHAASANVHSTCSWCSQLSIHAFIITRNRIQREISTMVSPGYCLLPWTYTKLGWAAHPMILMQQAQTCIHSVAAAPGYPSMQSSSLGDRYRERYR